MSIKARVAYCDKFNIRHYCIFSIPFLQVHPGRFRGVCPFGSYPLCCRLSANPGHWHGYYAGKLLAYFVFVLHFLKLIRQKLLNLYWTHTGAYYHHQEGFHYLSPGHLCARWRFDRSRPCHHLRSLGRHHCVVTCHCWARYLPSCRSPRLHIT